MVIMIKRSLVKSLKICELSTTALLSSMDRKCDCTYSRMIHYFIFIISLFFYFLMNHSTYSHIAPSVEDKRTGVESLWIFKLLTRERFIILTTRLLLF